MNKKKLASRLVFTGGVVELLIAVLHFLMPFQLLRAEEIAKLPDDYRSFLFLVTVAIGLLLAVFGVLCIYFSKKLLLGDATAWVFGLSQGILWLGRTVLELILPVRIPLFFLPNPTILILPATILLAMLFLVPLLAFRAELLD